MPLLVRNNERNATVFSKGAILATWTAAGDPMGDDVQWVPDELKDDVDFLKSVQRGVLTVEDASDPDLLSKIQQQSAQFQTRRQTSSAQVESVLDRRQDRDIVQVSCIGPNPNGRGGLCEANVLVRSALSGETPPLCPRHESLSTQFFLAESGSAGEGASGTRAGRVDRVWKRTEIAPPVKGQG